jgi:DNA-binding transcriptional MerR regulator
MAQHGTIRSAAPTRNASAIPDKLYFRIGEVSKLCAVPAYVLRFWESEFPQLKPHKGGTGQRLYRRRDVEMALHIKTLLYEEGYTIPGARQALKTEQRQKEPQLSLAIVEPEELAPASKKLKRLQKDLRELLNLLSTAPPKGAVHAFRAAKTTRTAPPPPNSDDLFD